MDSCRLLQENGRIYAVCRGKLSLFPCDEQEQDRLDLFHELFAVVQRAHHLPCAPRPTGKPRFLNLGCGTGIWAIDLATAYPEAYVLGVDVVATQPLEHPPNCEFNTPFDFEKDWTRGEPWDLIHLQMGCGSVSNRPSVYHKAFAHLHPGGWFEQLEIDFAPRCDNGSLDGTALAYWYEHLKKATEQLGHPITCNSHEIVAELQKAGFAEVWHSSVLLPLSPWPLSLTGRYIGRWYNLAITQSIETLSLAPFSRVYGWPMSTIQLLAAGVKSDICQTRIHSYNVLHIYRARNKNTT